MKGRLFLLLAGFLLGLLLLEGMVRLAGDLILPTGLRYALSVQDFVREWSTLFTNDPYLGTILKPDLDVTLSLPGEYRYRVQTSDLGLGGAGFRDAAPNGAAVAVAVGDSFTWGLGVAAEETWVTRLSESLGTKVLNLGVPGHGSIQTRRILERTALPLHPRLILWGFVPNDLEDAAVFSGRVPADVRPPDALDRLFQSLRPTSRLAMVVEFALGRGPFSWAQGYVEVERPGFDMRFHPSLAARQTDLASEQIDAGWWLTRQALLEAKQMADDAGATLVILLFPMRERTYRQLLQEVAPEEDEAVYSADALWLRMLDFGQEVGIEMIDLTTAFTAHAEAGEPLYFRTDGHWNAAGHAVAAEAIYEGLRQKGLLERNASTESTR